MDDLLSEKEQIETMRSWWQENGRYIIGGIILGVGILVGWNQWKDYKLVTQLEASVLYETLSNEVSDSKLEAAETVANDLYENYSSTTYPALAKLAIPLLVVVASSPAIVILPSAFVTSIPSPAVKVPAAKSPLEP